MEAVQQLIEHSVINAAKAIEDQLDAELHKLENLQARPLCFNFLRCYKRANERGFPLHISEI